MKILNHVVAALLIKTAAVAALEPNTGSLKVDASGVRNTNGKVMVAVYDDVKAYNGTDAVAAVAIAAVRPQNAHASVTFNNLKAGKYAAIIFHDENSNFDLDFSGEIPTEGYAVSGAKGRFDEPSFTEASVPVGGAAKTVSLKLFYFN